MFGSKITQTPIRAQKTFPNLPLLPFLNSFKKLLDTPAEQA